MMWLFGYAVGKSGAHVMYGDALAGFGFALDAECKNNPAESLLNALDKDQTRQQESDGTNRVGMPNVWARHMELLQSDRESADTIMMWLFGFAVAKTGSHLFDRAA